MSRATISREEISEGDKHYSALYIDTKNAILVLLSEGEEQLGTLAASVPSTIEIRTQPVFSSILLGDRNTTTTRMLAELCAVKTGKISLISVFLKTIDETVAAPILVRLFKKVTEAAATGNNSKGEKAAT
ncbi:hypothetical protein KAX01_01355 [Candidatus Bathyarchaeota archaeon]|nr:hypothetical protein [Candidatus Bathyarchaeota archaeon]